MSALTSGASSVQRGVLSRRLATCGTNATVLSAAEKSAVLRRAEPRCELHLDLLTVRGVATRRNGLSGTTKVTQVWEP
ncbi:MAG TPA: hypothetical protein VNO32_47395, partial [Candidatus Acidoferrum sp.]|nr:hypothetical protein [Candidatus Acidoferrum sp.]